MVSKKKAGKRDFKRLAEPGDWGWNPQVLEKDLSEATKETIERIREEFARTYEGAHYDGRSIINNIIERAHE